ncbi:MAG: bifunctional (p)ppGpp synthetase/guanosine-3',5'-bis(diphosphate) 3'-pyrophosphohydrolase [Gammaproteobacteria bacterium]|nr:bifunctional (p)ppGpp synthetase/guanosine-3',5'-bis(diphosphate) 3'-pyrophosphohydrolase [Gammaproteobacteria bacterium]
MVKVQQEVPRTPSGKIDISAWVDHVCADHEHLETAPLLQVGNWLQDQDERFILPGLQLAELVADLNMDLVSVQAALLYRPVRFSKFDESTLPNLVDTCVIELAKSVAAMATSSLLEMSNSPLLEKERRNQVENVKRMLVAMIDDARVAVIKLAERVVALRRAKNYSASRRLRIAQEASFVFAPLAGRLGIGQVKWELEDLAMRYTHGEVYQDIAKQLRGRRVDREAQITQLVEQVREKLHQHDIEADVYGRAKHIFSIWRKMQSKEVSLDQVYDVRAVRVVVSNLAECYAALGIIHTSWKHIPSEFDDYVAVPKENGYRSIHTAVDVGEGAMLEIQIRTQQMHADAELGVCAHWSYKGEEGDDQGYSAKMEWLRQVMEWHDELDGTERLSTLLHHRMSDARIFVSTPKGHVLDLPPGATVLDFAYRVHTDVGHACRAAIVDGISVGLSQSLQTGQQVEVLTGPTHAPRRDWLEPLLGFITTDRAKAKIFSYFKCLDGKEKENIGRLVVQEGLVTLGYELPADSQLTPFIASFQYHGVDNVGSLFARVGSGAVSYFELIIAILSSECFDGQPELRGMLQTGETQAIRLNITAENRDGLFHDVTRIIGQLEYPLIGTTGRVSNTSGQAIITIDTQLQSWADCLALASHIKLLESVLEVRSVKQ